jgi:hypothetical protein
MIDCQGCNDLVFKRDGSHSCFLFPYSEQISNCPCMKCLCKVICARKSNCSILEEDYMTKKIKNTGHVMCYETLYKVKLKEKNVGDYITKSRV